MTTQQPFEREAAASPARECTAQGDGILAWLETEVTRAEQTPGHRREAKQARRFIERYKAVRAAAQEPAEPVDVVAMLNHDMSTGLDAIEAAASRRHAQQRLAEMDAALPFIAEGYGWTEGER